MRPIGFSPNLMTEDFLAALFILLQPWRWQVGDDLQKFEIELKNITKQPNIWLFNSGRSAFLAALKAMSIGPGDEVIIQAFSCVAVPSPILWVGARPVYADVDPATYNLTPESIKKVLSRRTKAIVVQHTFGRPAPIKEILALAKSRKLWVIEDCAHALGETYEGKPLGTLGDAAFFSFGRDKVISTVFGGALATRQKTLAKGIAALYQATAYPSHGWIFQQLLHPILTFLILPFYERRLARGLIWLLQRLKALSLAIQPEEYLGERPAFFPRRYPNALAFLGRGQLARLSVFTAHRRAISEIYASQPLYSWLRYPWRAANPQALIKAAGRLGFSLGDWYDSPVAPAKTSLKAVGYELGSCPQAEALARTIVNLPTHISFSAAEAEQLRDWLKSHA